MSARLQLPDGTTYFIDDSGRKIVTGAMMGRPNQLPINLKASIKLRMEKLRWVDGDYDQGGAYWGRGVNGKDVYCAWGQWGIPFRPVMVFVRARTRQEAKEEVNVLLPNVTFFR